MKEHQSQKDESMFKGASARIFKNAEALRNNMTESELLLWEELRNKKFHGLKFRRQHPIQTFIADFYCHKLKLVIEVDGGYHQSKEQILKDEEKDEVLGFNDLKILRISDQEVINSIDSVLSRIEEYISTQ